MSGSKRHRLPLSYFAEGGDVGERLRAFGWSATPLGSPGDWPQSLRTLVRMMLDSRYSMWMGWGADLTFFYNDAYARDTLGRKHPWALGRPAREVWAEIWADIGPRIESVLRTGRATWDEGLLLFLERNGYPEETFHTFSYSPVYDDSGAMGGMLCVVTEETERVIARRRSTLLRDLATSLAGAKSEPDVIAAVERSLSGPMPDLPFSLSFLADDAGPHLAARSGTAANSRRTAFCGVSSWPVARVLETGEAVELESLPADCDTATGGPRPVGRALLIPVRSQTEKRPVGVFVAGLNPHRPLDDPYRGFIDLLVGQIAAALASVRAFEAERRRAEALAELDRAKTTFFSNVSHELRTPLTLMLGPLRDALSNSHGILPLGAATDLAMAQRHAMRLHRLVNSLLDFSRIEAGRLQASFEPTDLAALTADVASSFRSAVEKAGMRLVVDCPPDTTPVHVDRDMWEKIVLNLVANAFKYTLRGEITVRVASTDSAAVLTVSDTGTGIPEEAMPRLFERFFRVEGARGRTLEGTGIGLALVAELVRLHGGKVTAESRLGEGSTFTVTLPAGSLHLPRDRVRSGPPREALAGSAVQAFLDEANSWVSGAETPHDDDAAGVAVSGPHRGDAPVIVLADDNADMRGYVKRLLSHRYRVIDVGDGEAALDAVRRQNPAILLSDVMMPKLDGFGLLREIRQDPGTASLPVVFLSARAGEEARIEGMRRGADDYLVKPFSSRELIARVDAQVELARVRREAESSTRAVEERTRTILENLGDPFVAIDRDWRISFANRMACALTAGDPREIIGRVFWDVYPRLVGHPLEATYRRAMAGERVREEAQGPYTGRWFDVCMYPVPGGLAVHARDVTERIAAQEALRRSEASLEAELSDSLLLHRVGSELLTDRDIRTLYARITETAAELLESDFASLQMLDPLSGEGFGELELLAFRGFNPEAARFWERVGAESAGSCAAALRTGRRVIVTDVETCAWMAGTADLATFRGTGIRSMQTTPLVARDGHIVGMISTHWRSVHEPMERELRGLDILARQAADLIELRSGAAQGQPPGTASPARRGEVSSGETV